MLYTGFAIAAPLSPEAALAKLAQETEPARLRGLHEPHDKYFQGKITGATFRIRRIAGYRSDFLPLVFGAATPSAAGARINIVMRPPLSPLVFIAVYTIAALGVLGLCLLTAPQGAYFPLGMLAVVWGPLGYISQREARMQKQKLLEIFGGTIAAR